jgi:rhodanese-related sulfurtransferase
MTMTDNEQCREASPDECRRMIDGEGCRVIDVRTPEEFGQGHLENAVNIDFFAPNFRERLDTLERDRTYVVYCKKGARGAKAMDLMRQAGFSRVYNVSGGYENWSSRGLPVQR